MQIISNLLKLTTPQEESRNVSKFYNKMSVQELQLLAPNVSLIIDH
jgi:hypothetical protein